MIGANFWIYLFNTRVLSSGTKSQVSLYMTQCIYFIVYNDHGSMMYKMVDEYLSCGILANKSFKLYDFTF